MVNFDQFRNIKEIKHVEYSTILNYHNRITDHPCKATVIVEMNVREFYPNWDDIENLVQDFHPCTLEELCGQIHDILTAGLDAEIKVVCQHITSNGATITATTFNTYNNNHEL